MLGDRWSLLIIRDTMLQGDRTYKTFPECYEGIATNILADRLRKLAACGIITTKPDPSERRKVIYLLTRKGIDLAPVLTEMVLWAAAHENTGNQALVKQMRADKEKFLAGVRNAGQPGNLLKDSLQQEFSRASRISRVRPRASHWFSNS